MTKLKAPTKSNPSKVAGALAGDHHDILNNSKNHSAHYSAIKCTSYFRE